MHIVIYTSRTCSWKSYSVVSKTTFLSTNPSLIPTLPWNDWLMEMLFQKKTNDDSVACPTFVNHVMAVKPQQALLVMNISGHIVLSELNYPFVSSGLSHTCNSEKKEQIRNRSKRPWAWKVRMFKLKSLSVTGPLSLGCREKKEKKSSAILEWVQLLVIWPF